MGELSAHINHEPDAFDACPALSLFNLQTERTPMHQFIITAMVKALRPALKDRERAEQILEKFWTDKMALVWDLQDVHTAANEREVALTNQEAITVLQELHHHHDPQLGIRWEDLTSYIEEYALGRKLTQAEVKRFVHKNILTINRKRQQTIKP